LFNEKDLEKIIELYVINPDVYKYAYENCDEYKIFIDNLDEDMKRRIEFARKANGFSNKAGKFRNGLIHASTFGLSYGVSKLFSINKKSKEQMIKETVESHEFKELFRTLYRQVILNT